MSNLFRCLVVIVIASMTGCTGIPERVAPVTSFKMERYLGTWYEIARLDHSFERGLSKVTATYSLNEDGSVKVINKGFDAKNNEWSEAEGKAWFVGPEDVAHLKVSFFGPFYGSYVVFFLEPDYSTALVSGYSTNYFWILSRNRSLSQSKVQYYLSIAEQKGFDTGQIILPEQ